MPSVLGEHVIDRILPNENVLAFTTRYGRDMMWQLQQNMYQSYNLYTICHRLPEEHLSWEGGMQKNNFQKCNHPLPSHFSKRVFGDLLYG